MTATYEIKCVNSIISEWKRYGVCLDMAVEMVHKAIERSRYYEMRSDWNEDALEYMIENWDSIA